MDPFSLDELYRHLLAHEQCLEQQLSKAAELAFSTANMATQNTTNRGRDGRGSYGRGSSSNQNSRGKRGRGRGSSKSSSNPFSFGTPRVVSQVCNKPGHAAISCYHRFDHSYQADPPTTTQAFYSSPSAIQDDNWYPDTGASHHLTPNFFNLNVSSKAYSGTDQITIGNGQGLPISHIGNASLSTPNHSFSLKHVLYVPNACKNFSLLVNLLKTILYFLSFMLTSQCIFLGYSSHHKGYKCLNIPTGRIYISRDVLFDEFTFPFANKNTFTYFFIAQHF